MTTADAAVPVVEEPKRGIRLGVWALIFGLFPVLWVALVAIFGLLGSSVDGMDEAAYVMFFAAFLVLPVGVIVAIALGALALARNRPLGKILGAIGILLAIAMLVLTLVVLLGSNGPLSWTNF